jgi:hypothetical protein
MAMTNRQTPRVILRRARPGRFDEMEVLVVEMGIGGAKFEHSQRLDVGRTGAFSCSPLSVPAVVRHSVVLPTPTGFVYHSGVAFTRVTPAEKDLLLELLVHEAREQVVEWESNLAGDTPLPQRGTVPHSAVAPSFISFRLLPSGWQRAVTIDPNQLLDGVTIVEETPAEEVEMLLRTYEAADQPVRELIRRIAMLAILERLQGQ